MFPSVFDGGRALRWFDTLWTSSAGQSVTEIVFPAMLLAGGLLMLLKPLWWYDNIYRAWTPPESRPEKRVLENKYRVLSLPVVGMGIYLLWSAVFR